MKIKTITLIYMLFIATIIAAADEGRLRWLFSLAGKVPEGDKIGHFLLIGSLAWLLNASLGWRRSQVLGRAVLLGSMIVFAFGTIEECSQRFFPSRTFELLDLLGDYTGIAVAGLLAPRLDVFSNTIMARLRRARCARACGELP
ncbi:MAG: VanZ family protein [Verrucomicrobiota bacterium]